MGNLPAGFEDLQEFVAHWDVPNSDARWHRRAGTDYGEIKRFYEAVLARADDALAYCEQFDLHDMPDDAARLFRLLLALTQASMAVELHQFPRVPHSAFPHAMSITRGMSPYG